MGLFTRKPEPTNAPAPTSARFPVLPQIVELPPYKRGDKVWQTVPSGKRYAATVASCEWDDTCGLHGEWSIHLAYYCNDDSKEIHYTWTNEKEVSKA